MTTASLLRLHAAVPGVLSLMVGAVLAPVAEGALGLGMSPPAWLLHPVLVTAFAVALFLPLYAIWRRWIGIRSVPVTPPPHEESEFAEAQADGQGVDAA